jgi:hypothetical protein
VHDSEDTTVNARIKSKSTSSRNNRGQVKNNIGQTADDGSENVTQNKLNNKNNMRKNVTLKPKVHTETQEFDALKLPADLHNDPRIAKPVAKHMSEEGYEVKMYNGIMVKGSRKDRQVIANRIESSMTFVDFDPSTKEKPAPRAANKRTVDPNTVQMEAEGELEIKKEREVKTDEDKLNPRSGDLHEDLDQEIKGENLEQHEVARNNERGLDADQENEVKIDLENPTQIIF